MSINFSTSADLSLQAPSPNFPKYPRKPRTGHDPRSKILCKILQMPRILNPEAGEVVVPRVLGHRVAVAVEELVGAEEVQVLPSMARVSHQGLRQVLALKLVDGTKRLLLRLATTRGIQRPQQAHGIPTVKTRLHLLRQRIQRSQSRKRAPEFRRKERRRLGLRCLQRQNRLPHRLSPP
jgi:hypothetical protein